jgi:hypothetical protein
MASGGISYIWHPGATLSDSTIANPVAGPTTSTCYWVVGTASGGCSNTDTVCITVLGNPALPTIVKGGDTLYCSPATYASYQWYLGGTPIAGATGSYYHYTVNGNYYVQVFNAFGCSSSSAIFTVSDVGISEFSDGSLMSIYPNPTSGNLTIDLDMKGASEMKLSIVNISGQVIWSEEIAATAGSNKKQIDLSNFASGMYYLSVRSEKEMINRKIVKQ